MQVWYTQQIIVEWENKVNAELRIIICFTIEQIRTAFIPIHDDTMQYVWAGGIYICIIAVYLLVRTIVQHRIKHSIYVTEYKTRNEMRMDCGSFYTHVKNRIIRPQASSV
jgi:hypothetical protein